MKLLDVFYLFAVQGFFRYLISIEAQRSKSLRDFVVDGTLKKPIRYP